LRSFSNNSKLLDLDAGAQQAQQDAKEAANNFINKVDELKLIEEIEAVPHWRSKVMESKVPILLQCHADWS